MQYDWLKILEKPQKLHISKEMCKSRDLDSSIIVGDQKNEEIAIFITNNFQNSNYHLQI